MTTFVTPVFTTSVSLKRGPHMEAKVYDFAGEMLTVSEASRKYSIARKTLADRLDRGIAPVDAVLNLPSEQKARAEQLATWAGNMTAEMLQIAYVNNPERFRLWV